MDIFNINIEFNHDAFRGAIAKCLADEDKGYVCVVDGNVLTMAQKNEAYRQIINNAYVNTCDGSSIAIMCNKIYGTNYTAYSGPQVFEEFIEKSEYRQLLLGNTEERFKEIKNKLKSNGRTSDHLSYLPIPFAKIDEFDYDGIAEQVNTIKPDFIWASLGAPKQEFFCAKLLPHIEYGVLFGIGAAFNFYVEDIHVSKFTWFKRLFKEPRKQIDRCMNYITIIPKIYRAEKMIQKQKNNSVV